MYLWYYKHMNKIIVGLLILIVILLAFLVFQPKENEQKLPSAQNIETTTQNNLDGWKLVSVNNNQAYYNEKWKPILGDNGYSFELPSGNFLNWQYTGGTCIAGESYKPFVYGISESACVKSWSAWLGVKSVHEKNTPEDLAALGDFVEKNK